MTDQTKGDRKDDGPDNNERNNRASEDGSLRGNLLLEEFKEAWLHYRHIELLRIKHLAFFFTAFLAGTGVVAAFAKTDTPSKLQLSAAALFIFVLIIIGAFVRRSIRQWGPPMFHYENVFTKVRKVIYGNEYEKYNELFDVREDDAVKINSPKGVIQLGAERVVDILLVVAILTEAWVLVLLVPLLVLP